MKLAVLSESSADEAAVRVLVDGLLDRQTRLIAFSLRTRGWPAVFRELPAVLRELHYHREAEGLVVVMDSDFSPVHRVAHEQPDGADAKCRLCRLRQIAAQVQAQLRPVAGRPPLKTAFGVAVPTVEAWYRSGLDPRVTEAAWILGLQSQSFLYTKNSLKQDVYGTDRPSLALETSRATEAAQRLVQNLPLLESLFPTGFESLARDVRSW
ncbi:MAG: hypothetical protein ACRD2L_25430 [Terriglobia bacterium]